MAVKGNVRTSRLKWYFRCIVAISIAVISIVAINIAATSTSAVSNVASQDFAQESNYAPSAGLGSNDAIITAPASALPGHVYVLNNCEIVTEKPPSELDKLYSTAEEPSSHRRTTSSTATITASFTVTPSRLIVVDENDTITEIWSNTTGLKGSFYSLRVKEGRPQGSEHPLTQAILAQYNGLLGEVDWSGAGRVY